MKKRVFVGFAMALALGACDAADWPQYNEEPGAPVLDPVHLSGVEEPLPRLEEPTVFVIPAGQSSEDFGPEIAKVLQLSSDISDDTMVYQLLQIGRVHKGQWVGCGTSQCTAPRPFQTGRCSRRSSSLCAWWTSSSSRESWGHLALPHLRDPLILKSTI